MQISFAGRNLSISEIKTEFFAALAVYMTLSYVFLLNPVLLSKTGMNITAAFGATVLASSISTLIMGLWARLPIALATAPSITTFFVSYVCLELGVSWQGALAASMISGVISVAMAWLSVKHKLIESVPPALQVGVVFSICGFLIGNGMRQAGVISYDSGLIDISALSWSNLFSASSLVMFIGLTTTVIFRMKWFKFSGAPLVGILVATFVAMSLGIKSESEARFSYEMFDAFWAFEFRELLDTKIITPILVFFIIDFYGGVGKIIGLFSSEESEFLKNNKKKIKRALYVDGYGNIIGGALGASSIAVFVSSQVGISMGAKTGLSAIFLSFFMLLSLFFIPLVGAIPVVATSGILIYIGLLLVFPLNRLKDGKQALNYLDLSVCFASGLVAFLTFGIDLAIFISFGYYASKIVVSGLIKDNWVILATSLLLGIAVVAKYVF